MVATNFGGSNGDETYVGLGDGERSIVIGTADQARQVITFLRKALAAGVFDDA